MRNARTNDVWRELYKTEGPRVSELSIQYAGVAGLSDGALSVQGPMALLCGENGVGKTRVLRLIHSALGGPQGDFLPDNRPVPGAVSAVTLTRRKVAANGTAMEALTTSLAIQAAFAPAAGGAQVRLFDPTIQIPYLLHLIRNDQSFSDLYEGVTPQTLVGEGTADASRIIGRMYDRIDIYEIPDYQGHEVTPYFRVTVGQYSYGAEEMGLGELSLLFAYWVLLRIPTESILLLEEPESFIAPRSQRALVDLVAATAVSKRLFVVLTSHSGVIAERIPNTHLILVSRTGHTVAFLANPPIHLLIERLNFAKQMSSMHAYLALRELQFDRIARTDHRWAGVSPPWLEGANCPT